MNDPSAALQRLSDALNAGDPDAVMACFAPDATVELMSGEERIVFNGIGIRGAVDSLLAGFDGVRLTAISRQISASEVVEESVLSGTHAGSFAGVQPTSVRARVNMKMRAAAAPDSSLQSLWVEADTRALFAQISDNDDVVGVTGGLVALARERHGAALAVGAARSPALRAAHQGPSTIFSGSRRRWVVLGVAGGLLLVAFLSWRPGSTGPAFQATADQSVPTQSLTSRPSTSPAHPTTAAVPKTVAPSVLPAIRIAAPKSVPHVQKGKQVVLNSDVLFGFDSAALTPAARTALTRVAGQVRTAGVTGTIQVNGYTDNLGSVAYDLALSRARALAVAGVLQKGLAGRPVTLAPQGFGRASPIAPNTSDASRARNRRVTIVLPAPR